MNWSLNIFLLLTLVCLCFTTKWWERPTSINLSGSAKVYAMSWCGLLSISSFPMVFTSCWLSVGERATLVPPCTATHVHLEWDFDTQLAVWVFYTRSTLLPMFWGFLLWSPHSHVSHQLGCASSPFAPQLLTHYLFWQYQHCQHVQQPQSSTSLQIPYSPLPLTYS